MPRWKICIVVCLLSLAASTTLSADLKLMSVQVRNGQLRESPSFLGRVVATLSYGDQVQVYEEKDAWVKVGRPGTNLSGWIHSSSLTPKRIVLRPGSRDAEVAASSDELALAGKGFNSDVEAEFRRKHTTIDFTTIDAMEKIKIAPAEMQAFLKEGGVTPPQGLRPEASSRGSARGAQPEGGAK